MHGKIFFALGLALSLCACQTVHKNRVEQSDLPTAVHEVEPAPSPTPAPVNEAAATSPAQEIPAAKKGEAHASAQAQIKLINSKGKVVNAPQEAKLKNSEKEMTKVEVPAASEEEQAAAALATQQASGQMASANSPATTANAEAVENSRHPGPVSADKALGWLKNGNTRFVKGYLRKDGETAKDRLRLVASQQPHAAVLTCSDSRVPPELIFDQKLGEIYVVRVSGNILSSNTIAGLEYAVQYLGTNLVVLLGHDNCDASEEQISQSLLEKSKILSDAVASGEVKIARGFYHLDSGRVDWK